MKKKYWILLILVTVALIIFGVGMHILYPVTGNGAGLSAVKINEMVKYLNEKYGMELSAKQCVYSRREDYTYHDAFLYGTTYDVPNIAIFENDGSYITVTDRNGFLSDDGQLEELNSLLVGYFEDQTGLNIEFVEVRTASNGNITDPTLNRILHHSFNEKLTEENIGQFVELIWNDSELWLELIFYFEADEEIETQLQQITQQLGQFRKYSTLKSLRFFISDMEDLNIYYKTPVVHLQTGDENERESDERYIWGHYHVVNDVEHHYPIGENAYYQDVVYNSFVAGGYCMLEGYSGGFGDREVKTINQFGVVDLSDDALAGYLEEMQSYGIYRGYTILFRSGSDAGVSDLTIVDGDKYRWCFRWGTGPVELFAFKHGRLWELKTAYDCGYINYEDMDAILEKHREYFAEHHDWDYNLE